MTVVRLDIPERLHERILSYARMEHETPSEAIVSLLIFAVQGAKLSRLIRPTSEPDDDTVDLGPPLEWPVPQTRVPW